MSNKRHKFIVPHKQNPCMCIEKVSIKECDG